MTILLEELNAKGKCTLPIGRYWAARAEQGWRATAPDTVLTAGACVSQLGSKEWSFGQKLLHSCGFQMFWGY